MEAVASPKTGPKTDTSRKLALVYLRVSSKGQVKDLDREGLSIPAQREACYGKAEELGADIDEEFVDQAKSARTADRPALKAMLAYLEQHQGIDYVIVHEVSRLARNREDDAVIGIRIRKAGAKLVSVRENIDETPYGRLVHGIMSTVAEFQSAHNGTEALKGLLQKVKVGGTPGYTPLGYLNTREHKDGRMVATVIIDPERGPLIKWAFEAYATGDYSLNRLLDELTERGLRTRPTVAHDGKPITYSMLGRMLRNPYYAGFVPWRGAALPGRHDALVDMETFETVQDVLTAHNIAGEKLRRFPHYLKGSVFCRCGARLCIDEAKGRYLYYFCLGRAKRSGCRQRYVPVYEIEDAVLDYYKTVRLPQETAQQIREAISSEFERQRKQAKREVKRQQARLVKLQDQRRKLLHAHLEGAVPVDLLKEEQQRIGREIRQAEQLIARYDLEFEKIAVALQQALDLAVNCHWVYQHATPQVRRILNQALFEKLILEDSQVVDAILAEPFASLLGQNLAIPASQEDPEDSTSPDPQSVDTKNRSLVSLGRGSNVFQMAEEEGFEPSRELSPPTRLAGGRTRPTMRLLRVLHCTRPLSRWPRALPPRRAARAGPIRRPPGSPTAPGRAVSGSTRSPRPRTRRPPR